MLTADFSKHVAVRSFFALCKGADTATSLGLWLCVKHGDYQALVTHVISPKHYVDQHAIRLGGVIARQGVRTFERDYACISYLRKAEFLPLGVDTERAALTSFEADEQGNYEVNAWWRNDRPGIESDVAHVLDLAARNINYLLERAGLSRAQALLDYSRFGPGSTALLPRDRATLVRKTLFVGDVTPGAFMLASHLIGSDPVRFEAVTGIRPAGPACLLRSGLNRVWRPRLKLTSSGVEPVTRDGMLVGKWDVGNHYHDKLVFVPKDATTARTITAQAGVNLELQYGVAKILSSALRIWGIDLTSQEANQKAASRCYDPSTAPESTAGDATVDLRNASNRNAKVPVRFLLGGGEASRRILSVMESLRGQTWVHPVSGRVTPYQMFSAMGNGFTFELETLIFASIARVCAGKDAHRVLVFGDDIVCPKSSVPLLTRCLAAIGHTVNGRKSYSDGLFYESCGDHFFEGKYVTPAYQKSEPATAPECIRAHNRLVRLAYRLSLHNDSRGEQCVLESWLKPACKTYYTHALTSPELFPKGVPLQPLARTRIPLPLQTDRSHAFNRVLGSFKGELVPSQAPVGHLYEGDSGFAVGRHLIGAEGTLSVKYKWRSGCFTATGFSEIYPTVDWRHRPVYLDLAAYASWLRSPLEGAVAAERYEQTIKLSRSTYWDGWAELEWLPS